MVTAEKTYTAEEFWDIAALPHNADRRLELDEGVIVEVAPSKPINTIIAGRIIHFMNLFVLANDPGYVTTPDGGFKLADKRVRQPDAAFISRSRLPKIPKHFNLAPDLAVEIASPDEDVYRKAREYLDAGTRAVWVVYADERKLHVFRTAEAGALHVQRYRVGESVAAGGALPGFRLNVQDIFPA